ncbi:hypothetical protein [Trichloromonas sp.]|uniref:hypothetical protein n=1 Tax=Trichloromonas sp. TaxID=3069249 RepID=UPI002A3BFB2A|nr:hypothetical protein [Trichloromonas sp.]
MLKYNEYLILEKYEDNLKYTLSRLGIKDKNEIQYYLNAAKNGNLGHELKKNGKKFTFGILYAIFKDAIKAKKQSDLKIGTVKMVHRIAPILLAPFFPIIATLGYILGTSRAFNKILNPVITNPGNDYNSFLKKIIDKSMKVAEGEIPIKDRFIRAFVVSDDLVSAIKPEVLQEFSIYLADKIYNMEMDKEVPDYFVENELKIYINDRFNVDPKIPLKEGYSIKSFK